MRPGGGGEKGHSFEREMACRFSLWLTNGAKKDCIWRSDSSGARYTSTKFGAAGDLKAVHPLAWDFLNQYVLECKHWKNLDMINFLYGKDELFAALLKVRQEAKDLGRAFMLIAKQNNRPTCLFVGLNPLNPWQEEVIHNLPVNKHWLFNKEVVMAKMDDFLLACKPEMIILKEHGA